jgi:hypothetical protein
MLVNYPVLNYFMQDQVNLSHVQMDIFISLSRRFIKRTDLKIIHDDFCLTVKGDWESYIMSMITTKAFNRYQTYS